LRPGSGIGSGVGTVVILGWLGSGVDDFREVERFD
jgi:hypothetical protein